MGRGMVLEATVLVWSVFCLTEKPMKVQEVRCNQEHMGEMSASDVPGRLKRATFLRCHPIQPQPVNHSFAWNWSWAAKADICQEAVRLQTSEMEVTLRGADLVSPEGPSTQHLRS